MAPLQVILLLLLIRAPAILNSAEGHPGTAPLDPLVGSSGVSAAFVLCSFFLAHGFLVAIVSQRARIAVRLLHIPTASGPAISARMDHFFTIARWCTLAITAVHLYLLQVPTIIQGWLATTQLFKFIPLLPEAIYLAPAFLAWLGIWVASYQIEHAIRERSFPYRLANGLPVHEMPPLSRYLSMQIRHNFYIVLLVGISSLIEDVGDRLDSYIPHASDVGTPIAIVIVLAMVPWLVTRVWSTVPLKGPLRHRLDSLAGHYRLRFRNILIWKTHNQVTNAAILGWVPYSRYFLMTDALLETLTDQQIEAVFAHEVGHGVHKHILWYLVAIVGAWSLCFGLGSLTQIYLPHTFTAHLAAWTGHPDAAAAGCVTILMMLFFIFGFSFFSHRFEHQADWFAARHMGDQARRHPFSEQMPAIVLTQPANPEPHTLTEATALETMTIDQYVHGHLLTPPTSPALSQPLTTADITIRPPTPHLTPAVAGVEVFVASLDAIMELSHRSRNKRGWMHPSINNRVHLLRTMATNPDVAAAFHRRMITTRLLIAALVACGIASLLLANKLDPPKPIPEPEPQHVDPGSSDKMFVI